MCCIVRSTVLFTTFVASCILFSSPTPSNYIRQHCPAEGDGLDLLGYVEYQRHYRACVKAHKLALMAQRQFWNSLLRDTVHFADLKVGMGTICHADKLCSACIQQCVCIYHQNLGTQVPQLAISSSVEVEALECTVLSLYSCTAENLGHDVKY